MPRGAAQEHESHEDQSQHQIEARDETAPGLEFLRYFSRDGVDPFDEIEWELRSAVIANEKGETVFEQRDVEIPSRGPSRRPTSWSPSIFEVQIGAPERERSVKQLIGRVVDTITAGRARTSTSPARMICRHSATTSSTSWFSRRPRSTAPFGSIVVSNQRRSAPPASSTRSTTRWSRFSRWHARRACCSSLDRERAPTCRRSDPRERCSLAGERRPVRSRS